MSSFALNIKIGALDEFTSTFANLSRSLNRVGKSATAVGKKMTMGLTAPIVGLGVFSVKTAADFETLRTALETATGSASEAEKEFNRLKEFAASTPFQLEEVVSAFIKLKNMGLDPSQEALTAYGNTAGAMGKSLEQMIEAVADAATGEFERLKEFGIKASSEGNKVTFTFRGVKKTVRKEADEIEEYLRSIGLVDFAGGMDKQANTINGAFSNMTDSIKSALDIVGTDIAKTLDLNSRVRLFSDTINGLANSFNQLPAPIKEIAIWSAIGVAALGPIVAGVGQLIIGLGVMVALAPQIATGFAMITAAAPWLLLAAIVVGIGIMFKKLMDNVGGFKNAIILLGTTILDMLLAPMRLVALLWDKILGSFNLAPAWLTKFATGSITRDMATKFQNEESAGSSPASDAIREQKEINVNQNAKTDINVKFENAPRGTRSEVKSDSNANVSVEQGVAMEGVY